MPTIVEVSCFECGAKRTKPIGEVNRSARLGRKHFCDSKCAGASINRAKRSKEIVLPCPWCKKPFKTSTKRRAKKHCSPSCASKTSMSPERREAQRQAGLAHKANLLTAAETLKRREAWKYELLKPVLENEEHEFEFELGCFVFDLALLDKKVLVEFDGPNHSKAKQMKIDKEKEAAAKSHGYIVVRRSVLEASVISPETLEGLLEGAF